MFDDPFSILESDELPGMSHDHDHTESKELHKFETGAVRSTDADGTRYDLITPIGIRRLAEVYAEGAKKYGVNNWQKGIPYSNLINHALRHIYLFLEGDKSEPHIPHAIWNLMTLVHFMETRPELDDIHPKSDNE